MCVLIMVMIVSGCASGGQVIPPVPSSENEPAISPVDSDVIDNYFVEALEEVSSEDFSLADLQQSAEQLQPGFDETGNSALSLAEIHFADLAALLNVPEGELAASKNIAHLRLIEDAYQQGILTEAQEQSLLSQSVAANFIDYDALLGAKLGVSAEGIRAAINSEGGLASFIIEQGHEPQEVFDEIWPEIRDSVLDNCRLLGIECEDTQILECLPDLNPPVVYDNFPAETLDQLNGTYVGIPLFPGYCFGPIDETDPPGLEQGKNCRDNPDLCSDTINPPLGNINFGTSSGGTVGAGLYTTSDRALCDDSQQSFKGKSTTVQSGSKYDDWFGPNCANVDAKLVVTVTNGGYGAIIFYGDRDASCTFDKDKDYEITRVNQVNKGQVVLYCGQHARAHGLYISSGSQHVVNSVK